MAKKQQFEDPLEGIDPIMEQAYSVSHEKEEEVATPNHGQQRVSTEFDKVADQILAKNPTPVDQSEVLPANPVAENVSIHNIDTHYQDSANPINNPIDTEELLCSDDISLEEGDDSQDITDTINADFNESDIEYDISDIEFPSLTEVQGEKIDLNLFNKIPMNVSVELGRAKISLKEVFELTEGAIIELDRLVGEPLDLVVNGQVVAQGEVVAIDNSYGLRVTNIIAKLN